VIPELERQLGDLPSFQEESSIPDWIALLKSKGLQVPQPATLPRILDSLISELIEPQCQQPTLVWGHPIIMSPLAKQHDSRAAGRFELFIEQKEFVNAYIELNDPQIQRERFELQVQDRAKGDRDAQMMDEQYCDTLEYGLPPTVGWGIGMDRVAMLFTQSTHIRDVLAFPLTKPE
jgi:lysyl-tRNA synthetase class 2